MLLIPCLHSVNWGRVFADVRCTSSCYFLLSFFAIWFACRGQTIESLVHSLSLGFVLSTQLYPCGSRLLTVRVNFFGSVSVFSFQKACPCDNGRLSVRYKLLAWSRQVGVVPSLQRSHAEEQRRAIDIKCSHETDLGHDKLTIQNNMKIF